ncbi:MAG: dihydroneopterin aldolase [Cellvibrionales bacterium TMED148]|nr:dihydroneopterin aldolase [Porticoccaceae bacterium]RPG90710.1 MAG: dihydroneopterin aldolase [Cellvibrionales bacterium TMED148]|tara:strand:- start:214 stop:570 length:357 start_codon:yes stop_codon:yes gene_type:complete
MDLVYIKNLRIETVIGIYDWEREIKQVVSMDLEMAADISMAAQTDDIEHALNYKLISKRIIKFVQEQNFKLIEAMAEEVAQIVIAEFSVPWIRLRLSKPGALRGSEDVGIIIERGSRR